jgi:hypothetical protein
MIRDYIYPDSAGEYFNFIDVIIENTWSQVDFSIEDSNFVLEHGNDRNVLSAANNSLTDAVRRLIHLF